MEFCASNIRSHFHVDVLAVITGTGMDKASNEDLTA